MKPIHRLIKIGQELAAKRQARKLGRNLANRQDCPIYDRWLEKKAEDAVLALPQRLQKIALEECEKTTNEYHREVITGSDGRRYSAYDMDQAMLGSNY